MKCRYCGAILSRDGEWFSIREYDETIMIAYPFCSHTCMRGYLLEETDKKK